MTWDEKTVALQGQLSLMRTSRESLNIKEKSCSLKIPDVKESAASKSASKIQAGPPGELLHHKLFLVVASCSEKQAKQWKIYKKGIETL